MIVLECPLDECKYETRSYRNRPYGRDWAILRRRLDKHLHDKHRKVWTTRDLGAHSLFRMLREKRQKRRVGLIKACIVSLQALLGDFR